MSSYERPSSIRQLIAARQADLDLSDSEIALAMGYDSPTVVTLMKSGSMRVPINKSGSLAKALQLDPAKVMRLLLGESNPEMLRSIEECLGLLALSGTETRLIKRLRQATEGQKTAPIFLDGNSIVAIITQQ